jgi:stalled ribosome alternative rescue factor ArfA
VLGTSEAVAVVATRKTKKKRIKPRNPYAKAVRFLKPKVVPPKKGKGSYRRKKTIGVE